MATPPEPPRRAASDAVALTALLAAAAVLRLHRLDAQLWLDEIGAVVASLRRPALEILGRWPSTVGHPLYDLAAHASLRLLGERPLAVRLPAALCGIASVGVLHRLARDLFGRGRALVASALFALSYHHVFYSQNARGYTALVLFYLVASLLAVRFHARGRVGARGGLAYAAAGALAAYSVLFGAVVVPGQAAAALLAGRRSRFPLRPFLGWALLAMLLAALLYAPFAGDLLALHAGQRALAASQRPGGGIVHRLGVVREALAGLSGAAGGAAGLAAAALLAVAGLADWRRRHPFSLAMLAVPVALELLVLLGVGVAVNPRYFAIALPLAYLALGNGLVTVLRPLRLPGVVEKALLALLVLASGLPLIRYYHTPKQDFLGAIARVEALAAPGDARAGVQLAGHVLRRYYGAGFVEVETLPELEELERSQSQPAPGRSLWVVTTLERHIEAGDPALLRHLREGYRLVETLPATLRDGEVRIYRRP